MENDYVPVSQLERYSSCSAVSLSIEIPKLRSLRLAISWSTSGGNKCTPGSSLPLFFTRYSTERAWLAKLMSMTLGIGSDQETISAAGLQSARKIRCLSRDVRARDQPRALQWLFRRER